MYPLGPSSSVPNSSTPKPRMMLQNGFKMRKLNDDVEKEKDNASLQRESNSTHAQANKLLVLSDPEAALVPSTTKSKTEEGTHQKVSAKAQLYKLCGVRHWKAPVYESCDENVPGNTRLFIVRVTVEIKEGSLITVLESFGDPQNKKKIAAEQAAEAALWFLKNVGHTLQTDKASGRERADKTALEDDGNRRTV